MIMLGNINQQYLLKKYNTYPLPKIFDPNSLPSITRENLVWYNEMHIKQEGGNHVYSNIRFPQDVDRIYNPNFGVYAPEDWRAT